MFTAAARSRRDSRRDAGATTRGRGLPRHKISFRRMASLTGGAQFGQALAHLLQMMALVAGKNIEQGAHRDLFAVGLAATIQRFGGEAAKQGYIGATQMLEFLREVLQ